MVSLHQWLGAAVIAVCAASAVAGLVAYRRGRAGRVVSNALVLAQTVLIAQAAVGLVLLSGGHRAPDRLHYAYGAIALGVVLAPWFYAPPEARRRLLWFAGTALLAGALGTRAYLTGS
jgi:heme A synthase